MLEYGGRTRFESFRMNGGEMEILQEIIIQSPANIIMAAEIVQKYMLFWQTA